jgi:hypothetical protein
LSAGPTDSAATCQVGHTRRVQTWLDMTEYDWREGGRRKEKVRAAEGKAQNGARKSACQKSACQKSACQVPCPPRNVGSEATVGYVPALWECASVFACTRFTAGAGQRAGLPSQIRATRVQSNSASLFDPTGRCPSLLRVQPGQSALV